MVELDFLALVSEQELDRVHNLTGDSSSTGQDRKAADKLDQASTEISFEHQRCKQILLRAISVVVGNSTTVKLSLNESM